MSHGSIKQIIAIESQTGSQTDRQTDRLTDTKSDT